MTNPRRLFAGEIRITKIRHSPYTVFTIRKARPYAFLTPNLRIVYLARRAGMYYYEMAEAGIGNGKSVSTLQRWYKRAYAEVRLRNDIESQRVGTG